MHLLREINDKLEYGMLEEDVNGVKQKRLYIEGVFLQSELKNKNGRVYPKPIMEKEVARYIKDKIETKQALGELNHPETPTVNPERASHKIVSLTESGNDWIGKALVLNTPMGQIVSGLINDGVRVGVSSRGVGTLKETNGVKYVQEDFKLSTAADVVLDPSAPDALVDGIMEGREWVMINEVWVEKNLDDTQKMIGETSKEERPKLAAEVLNNYITSLGNL